MFLNCTISGNTAGNDGGGLFNKAPFGIRTGGDLLESTVSGNGAGHDGGGIYTYYQASYFSSTISGNSAARNGGGLYGSPDMIHLTVTQNVADQDNNGTGDGGGVYCPYPDFDCYDNIVAENFDTPNNAGPGQKHRDLSGILHRGDYNLIQDTTGWTMPGTHNITGLPSVLGPLANNGGPTFTHALLLGSPALDAGDNTYNIDHDQRGQPIADGDCDEIAQPDIGAYEAPFNAFGINAAPTDFGLGIHPECEFPELFGGYFTFEQSHSQMFEHPLGDLTTADLRHLRRRKSPRRFGPTTPRISRGPAHRPFFGPLPPTPLASTCALCFRPRVTRSIPSERGLLSEAIFRSPTQFQQRSSWRTR